MLGKRQGGPKKATVAEGARCQKNKKKNFKVDLARKERDKLNKRRQNGSAVSRQVVRKQL